MPGQPTIYDVARAAGVAPSTVSRALARPGRVNAATGQRIRAVAAQMGYRANPQARALSTARTQMIAFAIADITNPFGFDIIRGAEHTAAEAGYTMILSDTQESGAREREVLERTLSTVEGVVLASSRMSDSAIRMIAKQKPTVVLNRVVLDVPSVVADNASGVCRAVEHLAELGHASLTYVAGPEASWADGVRWQAALESCRERSLKAKRIGPCAPTVQGGVSAGRAVADSGATAVVAYNDMVAIGMVRGLQRLGVRVPEDVSVIGFDDVLAARLVTPELTTVAAPLRTMGATAARILLRALSGVRTGAQGPVVLPTRLVARRSTGRPSADGNGRLHGLQSCRPHDP